MHALCTLAALRCVLIKARGGRGGHGGRALLHLAPDALGGAVYVAGQEVCLQQARTLQGRAGVAWGARSEPRCPASVGLERGTAAGVLRLCCR